jgi:hypothetical protein
MKWLPYILQILIKMSQAGIHTMYFNIFTLFFNNLTILINITDDNAIETYVPERAQTNV